MIIYGLNPVHEALRADPSRVRYVGVSRTHGGKLQRIVDQAKRVGVAVKQLPPEQIERLAGGGVHNGVIAEIAESSYADFDDAIADAATSFVLLLDGVQDPQNLGAILRVADAFSIDLVVIPLHESVGLTAAAMKASAGAAEWAKVAQVTNLSRAIEELKKREFWVYGADSDGDDVSTVDLRGKVAIVMGNEGSGMRRNVREHCDRVVSIPMSGHVDSLNVAAAAAVIAYEVRRQQK